MSNKLTRGGSFTVVPEIPYQPAIPAYTSWEEETVTRVEPGATTHGAWVTTTVPQSDSGGGTAGSQTRTVWDPNYPVTQPATTQAYTINKLVFHPAVPEVPGSPSYRVDKPPQGWNAFARSIGNTGSQGRAKFSVVPGVVGVAIGLAPYAVPTAGYGHIPQGLLFTGNKALNLRTGAVLAAYVNSDVFTIEVSGGTVKFLQNGASIGTEASSYDSRPLFLSASMYAAKDAVFDPSLIPIGGGSAAMVIPAAQMFARQGAKAQALMTIPAATMVAGNLANYAAMVIPMAAMYGAEGKKRADAAMTIPPASMLAFAGFLPVVLANFADMTAPLMAMTGHSLTGQIASAAMQIPVALMRAADRPYADALMTIPAPFMNGYNEPSDEAYIFATMRSAAPLTAVTELVAIMMDGLTVGATLSTTKVIEAAIVELVTASPSWATSMLIEAVMLAFVNSGSALGLPDGDTETWAFNIDSSGSTTYSNFNFNSYAQIGDQYYGAGPGGVFLLDGDTDAGSPIRARLSLGKLDFGTAVKKTISECYVGMSGKGNLFVKVIANGAAYVYKTRSYSDELEQQRVTFGKGLKANYLWLELYNESGADFEVDTVEFHVADLTRRI